MIEQHWDTLRGTELRYQAHTWALTGDVTVRNSGELLGVEARQADGVRHREATLYFGSASRSESLNPGNLDDHVQRLERAGTTQYLVVRNSHRTYRYRLQRLEYH
jgi:hypothetical protein